MIIWALVTSLVLSCCITWFLCTTKNRLQILDRPNSRSLHVDPVPRTGGLAIVLVLFANAVVACVAGAPPAILYWLFGPLSVLVVVAWVDDSGHVPVQWRLAVQLGVALVLVMGADLVPIESEQAAWLRIVVIVASVLFVTWMVNLYNFMDGMDGMAAGMAVIGFSGFAVLGWVGDAPLFVWLCLVTVTATLGFLAFNFPPARIFMGDTGSYSLGFLAAGFSLWGVKQGLFPLWCPLLVFSPFIVDASVTLVLRVQRRERVWEAHRQHYYQRLAAAGWPHRRVVLCAYGLMGLCSISAVLGAPIKGLWIWLVITVWAAIYTVLLRFVARQEMLP